MGLGLGNFRRASIKVKCSEIMLCSDSNHFYTNTVRPGMGERKQLRSPRILLDSVENSGTLYFLGAPRPIEVRVPFAN